jgi:hypothetical protein
MQDAAWTSNCERAPALKASFAQFDTSLKNFRNEFAVEIRLWA